MSTHAIPIYWWTITDSHDQLTTITLSLIIALAFGHVYIRMYIQANMVWVHNLLQLWLNWHICQLFNNKERLPYRSCSISWLCLTTLTDACNCLVGLGFELTLSGLESSALLTTLSVLACGLFFVMNLILILALLLPHLINSSSPATLTSTLIIIQIMLLSVSLSSVIV